MSIFALSSSGLILSLLLHPLGALAKNNDPDLVPPPILEAELSVSPEKPAVKPTPLPMKIKAAKVVKGKKKGRSLASVEPVDAIEPEPSFPANGDVVKAKSHGKCPAGYHVADFHGWLCTRD